MHTNVMYLKSNKVTNPDTINISLADNGAMIIHVYGLTIHEAKKLLEQLTKALEQGEVDR